ncbi:amino acid/polyamine transporter I [Multifurca ochricompacta]|uniref:Amino acid/polyamine transporter I n=1 Tax=Multifurca ochricompacta TaxID=376703 RepID=A0AAD4QPU7_9AGAM|nr:amino acid/polyamine transporter I [Multifurca ochricompacta]
MLDLGQLLGSGIFSVPGVVLNSVGSVGLSLSFWVIAPMFSLVALLSYTELASFFPGRSGAEVVFLEQAYPRPKFFVPTIFAFTAVLLSFSATNAVVFAQYTLSLFNLPITDFSQTVVALGVATFSVGVVATSTKLSLRAVNALSIFKVLSLVFVAVTGVAVLAGLTRISEPFANFHNIWQGSTTSPNSLAMALVKTNFAYTGWSNAFNVLGEVKGTSPVRTVRNAGLISLGIVMVLFFTVNVAYISAVPLDEIKGSGQLVGALFFKHVFGEHWASKILPVLVALSCVGNIVSISNQLTVGQARILREVARQGLLPYPTFFASIRPLGTPLGPVALKYALTVLVISVLPARDAFNFLLDLASYPGLVFDAATAIGLWRLRARRAREGLLKSPFQVWNIAVVLWLLKCTLLLVLPWVPPESGHADVSFWYATYCVVGIVLLLLCALYYYVWIVLMPKIGGYEIVEEEVELAGGAITSRLIRKYKLRPPEERPLLASPDHE